jgi:hypothetical protein
VAASSRCPQALQVVPKFPIDLPIPADHKLWHTLGYAALMWWFAQIFARAEARIVFALMLLLIGLMLEIAQLQGSRQVQFWDVVANVSGIIAAWLCAPPRVPNILVALERRLSDAGARGAYLSFAALQVHTRCMRRPSSTAIFLPFVTMSHASHSRCRHSLQRLRPAPAKLSDFFACETRAPWVSSSTP